MNTDHIKYRNMLMQVVLVIVTLGLYAIYWYYVTLKEMKIANGKDEGVGLWTHSHRQLIRGLALLV